MRFNRKHPPYIAVTVVTAVLVVLVSGQTKPGAAEFGEITKPPKMVPWKMTNNLSDWKRELSEIIKQHGKWRAEGKGRVSFKTLDSREKTLFAAFEYLRSLKLKVMPRNCDTKHIDLLVDRLKQGDFSNGYRQTYISHLRTFAGWIGKPHIVKATPKYFEGDLSLYSRKHNADRDKSWQGSGVSPLEVIKSIEEFDAFIGKQLMFSIAFGGRRKECVMFRPLENINLKEGIVTIEKGTKGGKKREVKIVSDYQRKVAKELIEFASQNRGGISNQDLGLIEALNRFDNVLRKFKVTKKGLGVTAHGLRHEFLINRFESLSGVPAPVRYIPKVVGLPQMIESVDNADLVEKIAALKDKDKFVWIQLELIRLFHIPAKMVVRVKPGKHVNAEMTHITLENPDTGIKTRYAIDSPDKLEVFTQAMILAIGNDGKIVDKKYNPFSGWVHLKNLMKKHGVKLSALKPEHLKATLPEVLPDMSFEEAKRVAHTEVERVRRARQITSQEAGHERISITSAYCGGFRSYVPRKRGF